MLTTVRAFGFFALLFAPLGGDPPAGVLQAFQSLPPEAKALVWRCAADANLVFPDAETYADGIFDGAAYVIYRRIRGNPLPYPTDPTLGPKPPGGDK